MIAHNESEENPPRRVSRLGLYLPASLLLGACVAWSAVWFYSARLAQQQLQQWLGAEKSNGRNWACVDEAIEGFPFRIELKCASIGLSGPGMGPMSLRAGALHAVTQIYQPKLVLADMSGPFVIETGETRLAADWDRLRISLRASDRLERLSIVASAPNLGLADPKGGAFSAKAKGAEFHLRYDPTRPAADRAIDVALSLQQADIPGTTFLTDSLEPIDLELSGAATQTLGLAGQGWRELLDRWRAEGGSFQIDHGKLVKGALLIEGSGTLGLDSSRRLQGQMNVTARGVGPLVSHLGGGTLSQVIGPLLDKKDGPAVQWPVRLQNGRIELGPFRSGPVLAPLY